jgi:hypothetical protein
MKFLPLAVLSLINLVGAQSVSLFVYDMNSVTQLWERFYADPNVLIVDVSHSSHASAVTDSAAVELGQQV